MALTIHGINELKRYMEGVMERADHHGQNVNKIALALMGAVIWRATGEIEVRTRLGSTANVLWFTVGNDDYVIAYNHKTSNIELRESNQNGISRATFNNQTELAEIKSIFSEL